MRRRQREQEFNSQWGDLATYNAEVSRGIVHTSEYDARMVLKQAEWNARAYRNLRIACGNEEKYDHRDDLEDGNNLRTGR